MKTEVVTHRLGKRKISLTISEATAKMGLLRTLLMDSVTYLLGNSEEDENLPSAKLAYKNADRIIGFFLYPAMIASVKSQTGFSDWPISFEEFSDIPEEFEVKWEEATFRLNPHWKYKDDTTEEEVEELRKKAIELTSDLENSTE